MSQPISALNADACPLLPPEAVALVDQFNTALSRLTAMETRYPRLADELATQRETLTLAHAELTASHYRVGFLGTTAAGKSTTFNNVLGVTPENAPAKSGTGLATTATITRLQRNAPGKENSLTVTFLTTEEYEHKRHILTEACEFPPGKPDHELLRDLEAARDRIARGDAKLKPGDVENLRLLIESRRDFSSEISPSAKTQKIGYADRAHWLNHATPSVPGKTRLLSNALLTFETDKIPITLELLDLPGLGASRLDTELTIEYLPRLNGVLIFVNAIQLADTNVQDILMHMRTIFKDGWAKRVWIVLTKFGALTEAHIDPDKNWFYDVAESLRAHGALMSNVFIVDNPFHRDSIVDPGSMPKRFFLGRSVDDPKYRQNVEFRPLFEQVIADGGIKNLREFLTRRLAGIVGEELRAGTQNKLRSVTARLDYLEESEKRRAEMSDEQREQARDCRNAVRDLIDQLKRRPAEYQQAVRELATKFEAIMQKTIPDTVWPGMDFEAIRQEFPALTRSLDRTSQIARQDILQSMQTKITQALRGLPTVAVSGGDSPLEAWERLSMEDARGGDWFHWFPAFGDGDLLERMEASGASLSEFNGDSMREVMQTKVQLVASSTVHAIRTRLRDQLTLLYRDLSTLVTN